jgi:hypothetical protein
MPTSYYIIIANKTRLLKLIYSFNIGVRFRIKLVRFENKFICFYPTTLMRHHTYL